MKLGIRNVVAAAVLAITGAAASASPMLWVGDSEGRLGKVDVSTGNVSVVGNMGTAMADIAFDQSGHLWGVSFDGLFRINTATGATERVGDSGASLNALVFGADGTLYAAGDGLYRLSTTSGAATRIGSGGGYSSSGDLAFIGGQLYLSSHDNASDALYVVDTATGAGSWIGSIGAANVYGMATDNNVDLYALSGNTIYSVDTASGAGTALVTYDSAMLSGAWGTAFLTESGGSEVPEPWSLGLLATGLLALGATRRRRAPAGR